MNDSQKAAITHAAGIALGWLAARYSLSPAQYAAIASDLSYVGAAVAWCYGVYAHYGMKKVPVTSTAIHLPSGPLDIGSVIPVGANAAVKVVG